MYVFPIEKWGFILQPAILVIPEGNPWKSKSKQTRSFRMIMDDPWIKDSRSEELGLGISCDLNPQLYPMNSNDMYVYLETQMGPLVLLERLALFWRVYLQK